MYNPAMDILWIIKNNLIAVAVKHSYNEKFHNNISCIKTEYCWSLITIAKGRFLAGTEVIYYS